MALINNIKTYLSENLTRKGKSIVKVIDQSLIKQESRLKDKKLTKTKIIS